MRILIMGLPGSGKTTLAKLLAEQLNATHINADVVRQKYNDWDFSPEGRLRQAERMRNLCDRENQLGKIVVADFVCPTPAAREIFQPDFVIWLNTIDESVYTDTNDCFQPPSCVDYRVDSFHDPREIVDALIPLIANRQSKMS